MRPRAAPNGRSNLPAAVGEPRADVPLALRTDEGRGPWSKISFLLDDPRISSPGAGVEATLTLDPTPGTPGSVRVADDAAGPPWVILACPPAWPGHAPDAAPGAPSGDAAAFGQAAEDILLASCYAAGLALAERLGVSTLFISSLGAAGEHPFPPERAAKIAMGHAVGHFARRPPPEFPAGVVFRLTAEEAAVYRDLVSTRAQWAAGRRRA